MQRTKKQQPAQEVKREYGKLESFDVLRAYEGRDVVFFTGVINGVTVYNMRVCTTKDGEDFIGFPSVKGKDGRYFNEAYFSFSPEDTALVIEAVEAKLNES